MDIHARPDRPMGLPDILTELGWDAEREADFVGHAAQGFLPGRITSSGGSIIATTAGGAVRIDRLQGTSALAADPLWPPTIGDWLALEPHADSDDEATVRAVLPRIGTFTRQRPADGRDQVIAANIDLALIVSSLDHDLNPRRIERYLVLASDGDIEPVVVLNKADVAEDASSARAAVATVAADVPVITVSARTGAGMDELRARLTQGVTACLLGSSGVGKSSLTNALLGADRQAVRETRADDSRGRHTTTHRELFALPGGALLIDTPGLRSVGMRGKASAIDASFEDVAILAASCRFADCRHLTEPGCAVRAAIDDGRLAPGRLESQRELEAERRSFEVRSDERSRRALERSRSKTYSRAGRDAMRFKRGG